MLIALLPALLAAGPLAPYVAELVLILFVSLILLVIILIMGSSRVNLPYKQYAIWAVAAIWIIFLLWRALAITGLI